MSSHDGYLKELPEYPGSEIYVEFTVTSWGAPATGPSYASGGDPAEPPEIEIDRIWVDDREIPYFDPSPWTKVKVWFMRKLGKRFIYPSNPEWDYLAAHAESQIFEDFPEPPTFDDY